MKRLVKILILLLALPYNGIADNLLRDSELEDILYEIAVPLIKVAGVKNTKIYLMQSDDLNAFTDGKDIYLSTELVLQFPNIDTLRGVIAHELGHIVGKHATRKQQSIEETQRTMNSSVIAGMASMILGALSGGSGYLGHAILAGGHHIATSNFLSYSRTCESAADQAAIKLLNSTKTSIKGLISFFEYLRHTNSQNVNKYDQTHPLDNERLKILNNAYNKSPFKETQISHQTKYRFERSIAKLLGFMRGRCIQYKLLAINPEYQQYCQAVASLKHSKFNEAIRPIDLLLTSKPNDPFYNELKGQILFEFGKREAITYYRKAQSADKNDPLITLGKAIVGLNTYEDPGNLMEFKNDLNIVLKAQPDNLVAMYYLAIYYKKIGDDTKNILTRAILASKAGDIAQAKKLAQTIMPKLKSGTTDWLIASDILSVNEKK